MTNPLSKISHIVVLMLENRSYDHMLGYLTLNGRTDLDGLDGTQEETYKGNVCKPFHLTTTRFDDDPDHEWDAVHDQLKTGFVRNFAKAKRKVQRPEDVMGYYDQNDVPVFDFLAREYVVCDNWFCSLPGPTQPNRLFALAGHSGGMKNNSTAMVGNHLMPTIFDFFSRDGRDWTYFYHDVPFIWLFEKYFLGKGKVIRPYAELVSMLAQGKLPKVAWVDPNFGEWPRDSHRHERENDDHPPIDCAKAQRLVGELYNNLIDAPGDLWSRTLLIITYDEHGGFYDHVMPPPAQDDRKAFRQYGVRVPAIIASPWVARGAAAHTVFDHTSILKTIITRFLPEMNGSELSLRVGTANHLGDLMLPAARADRPRYEALRAVDRPARITEAMMRRAPRPRTPHDAALPDSLTEAPVSFDSLLQQLMLKALSEAGGYDPYADDVAPSASGATNLQPRST